MSGLELLRVEDRNAKPTIANPKVQILESNLNWTIEDKGQADCCPTESKNYCYKS
jgi:hypothetical protein